MNASLTEILPNYSQERLDLFWYLVCERQTIYHKRHVLKQPYPWSDDRILSENRFTNIYRETDPGTQYAITHILETDRQPLDKAFNIMTYRLIGKKETHQQLGFLLLSEFDKRAIIEGMQAIASAGGPVFTSAYTVCPSRVVSECKIENVAEILAFLARDLPRFWCRATTCDTMEDAYAALELCYGYGRFLAYQCLVDLTYPIQGGAVLPLDANEWAAAGPGAKKGIEAIALRLVSAQSQQLDVMRWLHEHQEQEFQRLGYSFPQWNNQRLSLPNIQNSLCSFQKYVKLLAGGRYPIRYKPPALIN